MSQHDHHPAARPASHDHHTGCGGGHCGAAASHHPDEPEGCGCEHADSRWETRSLGAAGALLAVGLIAQWLAFLPPLAVRGCFVAAIAAGGWFLLPKAWRALRQRRADINLLMVVACGGAAVVGEWAEAATVVFLFGIAEWLEAWSDRRAQRAVRALLEVAPKTAYVARDGRFEETPVEAVEVGAIVAVRAGMGIPLDGEVVQGVSAVNQAPITGESVPVEKQPGALVYAGSINGDGALEVRVTKPAADTTLAQIVRLVAAAQEQRAPTQRFVDRFARYYTPAVTGLALLVFLLPPLVAGGDWAVWLYRACALLIIACPCALVISTPVSIVAGLTALARRGVLVKGGAHLESLGRLRALALDKTGTLTAGRPQVLAVESVDGTAPAELLRLAAAIDDHSPHPLACALVAHARAQGVAFPRATAFTAQVGRGAEGVVDGHVYFVGNHRFAHELGVCSPAVEERLAALEGRGASVVVVGHRPHAGCAGAVLGLIAVGDPVRPEARAALAALRAAGVAELVLLSGDNQRTAAAIAAEIGLTTARGDLLPADKVEAVKALRATHGTVAMAGDGVNDAPALAVATVGIAMGHGGTDAAIETADVALMRDDLTGLVDAVRTGRRTLSIIRFNIGFALGLKALFLALALAGHTSLWLAIVADTGATLLVIANALRLVGRDRGAGPAPVAASAPAAHDGQP